MDAQPTVLVVEDHRDIAEMICHYLQAKRYNVDYAGDGVTGLHLAVSQPVDLIVLDLSLPGLDGVALCRELRQTAQRDTPVIMLTARDTLDEKITGLDAGADDYLVKPFAMAELEARIRAQLRRHGHTLVRSVLTVGDLTLDKATYEVSRAGQLIKLTPTGFKILEVLMRASPAVVTRCELERAVWGDMLPDSDTLRSHLYLLRKKIDKPFATPLLHNRPGSGYQLLAD